MILRKKRNAAVQTPSLRSDKTFCVSILMIEFEVCVSKEVYLLKEINATHLHADS